MVQFDWATFAAFVQSLAGVVVLLAVLVSVGRHIQSLITLGALLKQLQDRFDAHVGDESVHCDAEAVSNRLTRLEDLQLNKK